jgi:bifunctional non-homologous end joining protein LigD
LLPFSSVMTPESDELRFVIHEHYARSHHFDLRLEQGGVLWSWAVPKGMPTDPDHNRLAVRVEDHALNHLDHEDPTPVPEAGDDAVRVRIWDQGTYRTVRTSPDKLVVDLNGRRIQGRYAVFRTDGDHWMVHLMNPFQEREGREIRGSSP